MIKAIIIGGSPIILDTEKQHSANWPSILAVLNAHLNRGKPVVFEGWNFYPKQINEINGDEKIKVIEITKEMSKENIFDQCLSYLT